MPASYSSGQPEEIVARLRRDGFAVSGGAQAAPLGGGVSSEIYLISDGDRKFVVKSALEKLKVAADWRADTGRNLSEQRYLQYVGTLLPGTVPQILFAPKDAGYFVMEYLGEDFANWKTLLLAGKCDADRAREAMSLLAQIHAASRGDAQLARDFETTENFRQLRTDPYFLWMTRDGPSSWAVPSGGEPWMPGPDVSGRSKEMATAQESRVPGNELLRREPGLAALIRDEVARLETAHDCLVHGDFSPKNILISRDRMVLLDCEVAWYGDPAFDISFFLNHLCLKALYHAPLEPGFRAMFEGAVDGYFRTGTVGDESGVLQKRCARLLLMLLLARVDGKSPVEYLTDESKKDFVRSFVSRYLPDGERGLEEVGSTWFEEVRRKFAAV